MVTKNTWIKGLNRDISKLKYSPENYLDALNMRVITDEGSSTYALENRKGTFFSFQLPTRIESTWISDFRGLTGSQTITINSNTLTITNVELKSNEQIVEEMNAFFISLSTSITAYYNNQYIVIYDYLAEIVTLSSSTTNGVPNTRSRTTGFTPYIIGWQSYLNYVVLIVGRSDSVSPNPVDSQPGAIYIFKINDSNNLVEYLDGTFNPEAQPLDNTKALKYIGNLGLSRFHEIYKHIQFRYENSEVLRCVWTDGNKSLRTINLFDPQVQATDEEQIDYLPGHLPQEPQIKIINGGFLPVGKYYLFYRLESISGAKSTISPLSNGITISNNELNNFDEYNGANPGTDSQKSIEVTVQNVDQTYDIIRFGYLVNQVQNIQEAFWFDEKFINQATDINESVSTVLNGNENEFPLDDITELGNINRPPEIFETLTVVRNRLAAANAKTRIFDVDFDSRTYRFKAPPIGTIYTSDLYDSTDLYGFPSRQITYDTGTGNYSFSQNGIPLIGNTMQTALQFDENADLINPYNNEDPSNPLNNGNWNTFSKYLLNPETLNHGGIGPNIKYEFIIEENIADLGTSSFNFITPETSVSEPLYLNSNQPNGYSYDINGSFNSMKSPYIKSLFTGYGRGEVYRFGIVFLDKKGYPTPVHWIGDIKFPGFSDSDSGENYAMSDVNGSALLTRQMGIKFTLDTNTSQFQNIKDKISGWYYVRLERTENNKTKLGSGKINTVVQTPSNKLMELYSLGQIPMNVGTGTALNNVLSFDFPNSHFNIDARYRDGDYLKPITGLIIPTPVLVAALPQNNLLKYPLNISDYNVGSNDDIEYRWRVDRSYSEDLLAADPSNGLPNPYYNMSSQDGNDATTNNFDQAGSLTDLITLVGSYTASSDNRSYFASYERFLNSQYGGNLYSDRLGQDYIPVSFQPYNPSINSGNMELTCFNGDVTVVYYDHQKLEQNFDTLSGYNTLSPSPNTEPRMAVYFPAECHNFNPEQRVYSDGATCHASNRGFGVSGSQPANVIIRNERINNVNRAFDNENNYTVYRTLGFNQSNITEEPNTIYITDPKFDGEKLDSWRDFRINNNLVVNGNYGPIKRLLTHKDKLYYYQEAGFGIAAVDERVIIDADDTSQTQLGTGTPLQRYDYISTETGLSHKWAVIVAADSIHHYDAFMSKWFKFMPGSGVLPLTDIKGLSGYFRGLNPAIKATDQILIDDEGSLHMEFDPIYNTVYLTSNISSQNSEFTISYNGFIDAFESFHSFIPELYLSSKRKLLSMNSDNDGFRNVYVHDQEGYNFIYQQFYPSLIKFRVNENSDFTKVFDNFVINNEVYSVLFNQNLNETITSLRVTNDYQDTGTITLTPGSNIRQTIRSWRTTVPLDNTTPSLRLKPRMVDNYIDVQFNIDSEGKKFVLHDVLTEYSTRGQIILKQKNG